MEYNDVDMIATLFPMDLHILNSPLPWQNDRHFADDSFKYIKIPLKFVPKGLINIIPSLAQRMA